MVHSFEKLDAHFIMDSETGSLYRVDRAAYLTARRRFETLTAAEEAEYAKLGERERAEAGAELDALRDEGILDAAAAPATATAPSGVIKSMCLNICHDCNLRCEYCFADEGRYNGERGKMSARTACDALDFLVKASRTRRHLEVDFFGGEPMMNFDVVKAAVAHARELEKTHDKAFRFTLTTNATLLSDEDIDYLNENMSNLVLSIDGRREVHDAVRKNAAGKGSFDTALANSLKLRQKRGNREYYVRGTYTARNLDFAADALALADCGFDQISLEPVVLPEGHPLALREEHLATLKAEYRRLAAAYRARWGTDGAFNFFHFNIDLDGGPCERKLLTGCSAGMEYVAVAANGDLYPCHQFVGDPAYRMGDVYAGITRPQIGDTFAGVNIHTKADCQKCWARYYCSGGCNANAVHFSHDLYRPLPLTCELTRERTECALALKALAAEADR